MNRLKYWALTVSLAGSLLMGGANPRAAIALSEAEVMSRLTTVPVFTLVDDKGNPIVGSIKDAQQQEKQVLLFFLSPQEALQQLAAYQKVKPEEGKKAEIRLLSMKEVMESFDRIKDKTKVVYSLEPHTVQLEKAIELLKKNGELVDKDGKLVTKNGKAFSPSVPLFYPTMKDKEGKTQLMPISAERVVDGKKQTETFVPLYLSKTDLERDLQNSLKQPEQEKVEVKVWMFNAFLSHLYNAKSEQEAPFRLIPSEESSKFVNSLLQQAAKDGQSAPKTN